MLTDPHDAHGRDGDGGARILREPGHPPRRALPEASAPGSHHDDGGGVGDQDRDDDDDDGHGHGHGYLHGRGGDRIRRGRRRGRRASERIPAVRLPEGGLPRQGGEKRKPWPWLGLGFRGVSRNRGCRFP